MSTFNMKLPTLVTSIYPRQLHPIVSITSTAHSAPSDIGGLFSGVFEHYREWMLISGRQLSPQWSIPDFVRMVLGNEAVQSLRFLKTVFYDFAIHGPGSWFFDEGIKLLDLINASQ